MLDNVWLRYPHRASGTKAPRTLRPLPLLRFAVSATGGAHLCSIQYYLRFWLSSCRTSLAVSALRIMRYGLRILELEYPVYTKVGARGGVFILDAGRLRQRWLTVRQRKLLMDACGALNDEQALLMKSIIGGSAFFWCIICANNHRQTPTTKFPVQRALWAWRIRHGLCIVSA